MQNNLLNLSILAFIGGIAGIVGGIVFLLNKKLARILGKYSVPFAAGVLLSVSLLNLLPESVEKIGNLGFSIALISFILSFLLEEYLAHLHHHETRTHTWEHHASVPLVLVGDSIHNFIDGIAIASAYLTDPQFGLVIALATFLHETPHEIGDFGILMANGWSRAKTFWANFFSALATFPGAFLVYFFLKKENSLIGILLAVSGGIFLYLGASDFLPEIGEEKTGIPAWKKFSLLLFGIVIVYLMTLVSIGH